MRPWRPRGPPLGSEELEVDPTPVSVLFPPAPGNLPVAVLLSVGVWLNGFGRAVKDHVARGPVPGRALLDSCDPSN